MVSRTLGAMLLSLTILSSCNIALFEAAGTDASAAAVSGDVVLYWSAPTERVNGDNMSTSEIGGYEIRYRSSSDDAYTTIIITDISTDEYFIDNVPDIDNTDFQVAVFDTEGIYSNFVTASER